MRQQNIYLQNQVINAVAEKSFDERKTFFKDSFGLWECSGLELMF